MNPKIHHFQLWCNCNGVPIAPLDGLTGPATRAAALALFNNKSAPAVTPLDIVGFAERIGCTPKQVRAVARVESAGGGYYDDGTVKLLFERHKFYSLTDGAVKGVTPYSNPVAGGYGVSSVAKLTAALAVDPWAAFAAASWGKFQVMGYHFEALGYSTPWDMVKAMRDSEAAHYDALVRFVLVNKLAAAMRALSTNPEDNRPFAKGFNGTAYEKNSYHTKLAEAMQ